MTLKQYYKIEKMCGGIMLATNKAFIKACLAYILPQAKHHHLYRDARHQFIRDGLRYRDKAQRIYRKAS